MTWVEFWKESIRREDKTRNKWNETYGLTKPTRRNLPDIDIETRKEYSQTPEPQPSRFGYSGIRLTPQSRSPSQRGPRADVQSTMANSIRWWGAARTAPDPRSLPHISQTWYSDSQTMPAAGSGGHSAKNGHYINGRVYGADSRRKMMWRHQQDVNKEAVHQNTIRNNWFRDTI